MNEIEQGNAILILAKKAAHEGKVTWLKLPDPEEDGGKDWEFWSGTTTELSFTIAGNEKTGQTDGAVVKGRFVVHMTPEISKYIFALRPSPETAP